MLLMNPTSPFQTPNFRKIWFSRSVSVFGDEIFLFTLPLLIYDLTGSGSQMAALVGFQFLPFVIFSILGGIFSDRFSLPKIIYLGNIISLCPLIVLFYLYSHGDLRVWQVYIVSLFLSSCAAVILPAYESAIPLSLKVEQVIKGNAAFELSNNATKLIGPLIAGFVFGIFGAKAAIILNFTSYIFAALFMIGVTISNVEPYLESFKESLFEGLTYLMKHSTLRWGVGLSFFTNLVVGAYLPIFIFSLKDLFQSTPQTIGAVLTIGGSASLVLANLAPWMNKKTSYHNIMLLTTAVTSISILCVGLSQTLVFLIIANAFYAVSESIYSISWRSLRQVISSSSILGRVSGNSRGIAFIGMSIGSFISAFYLSYFSVSSYFIVSGILVFLISIAFMILRPTIHFGEHKS